MLQDAIFLPQNEIRTNDEKGMTCVGGVRNCNGL